MLTYRHGDDATRGGLDLILSLTADQAEALGSDAGELAEFVDTVLIGLAALRAGCDPRVPAGGAVSLKDEPVSAGWAFDEWLIRDVVQLQNRLSGVRAAAIRRHAAGGASYSALAAAMAVPKATAQRRRDTVLSRGPAAAEIWAVAETPPTTVEYTDQSVLDGIAAGASWADPTMDPTTIDWPSRQAVAAIPFQVVDGRPVRPGPTTGVRYGRNSLGHWGEQLCADALVVGTDQDGRRRIVMGERADGHGWALPGGYVDLGETAAAAAIRELREETHLDLSEAAWTAGTPELGDDPRGSDESWMVTTVMRCDLPAGHLPPVVAGDDLADADWIPADDYTTLTEALAARGGQVFQAHRAILTRLLGQ